ncbi:hypothetical protein [Actinophytocola oryzae]|uniref:LppP/LprE lipoprotein n=1 Tax=Actinophytocola oryzae TaxID=502181 RepID=A0A4R7VUI8_9PSEU|nr:hypothetical protein [Actinophytocola oryzae]TDV53633.1 hypothetical protein CLV71_104101 [Actinophytocola oryzae]
MRRVLVLLCGVMLFGGCGVAGGVEVEGRASQVSPPPSTTTTPSGTPASADAVAVLRADETLDAKIKATLVPCPDGSYPIDDRYIDLTGDGVAELLVTLYPCTDTELKAKAMATGVRQATSGYAAYVYDLATHPPSRLLEVEDASLDLVVSTKERPGLLVIHNRWATRDDPCCPTDQTVVLYRWDGTKFIEVEPK